MFEWHEKSSVPEDLDTLEEEESENLLDNGCPFPCIEQGKNVISNWAAIVAKFAWQHG